MTKKNNLLYIFLLALILRLGYFLFLKSNYVFFGHPSDDVAYYQDWAMTIARGDWIGITAFPGMPLFPYYLAVLIRLCLGNWFAAVLFNLVLGSLNCVLVYRLAQRSFSDNTAILAGILTAANFILIYYDCLMMPVTLLITLTLLILLALHQPGPQSPKEWLILGILLGLACLGDGKFLLFAALLAAFLGWNDRKNLSQVILKTILPLFLGLLLIVGGVTLRNKIVSGHWVLITSQSGLSLFVGNNPDASGAYDNPEFIRPTHAGQDEDQRIFVEKTLKQKVTPVQVSDFYRSKAVQFITQDPVGYIQLLGKKIFLFFSDSEQANDIDLILQRNFKATLDINSYGILFPLALLGIFVAFRDKKQAHLPMLIILSQFLFCLIYFVTTRHRAPILPLLIIFETYAILWVVQKIKDKNFKILIAPILAVIVFLILFAPKPLNSAEIDFLNYSKACPLYLEKKDFQKAEKACQNALRLRPGDSNTHYNLATTYMNSGNYPQAEAHYLQAIQICHFNVDASFNLGHVYEETGRPQMALDSYQEVLKYQPTSLDARLRIATILQKQGKCAEAKPYYHEIIRIKPALAQQVKDFFRSCENP